MKQTKVDTSSHILAGNTLEIFHPRIVNGAVRGYQDRPQPIIRMIVFIDGYHIQHGRVCLQIKSLSHTQCEGQAGVLVGKPGTITSLGSLQQTMKTWGTKYWKHTYQMYSCWQLYTIHQSFQSSWLSLQIEYTFSPLLVILTVERCNKMWLPQHLGTIDLHAVPCLYMFQCKTIS